MFLSRIGAVGTLLAFVSRVHVPFQAEFLAVLRSIRFRPWLLRCYQHHYIYIYMCLWPRMPSPVFFVKNAFEDTPSRSSLQSTYRQAFTSFLRWLPSGHIAGKKGLEGQTGSSRKTGSPLCVSAFAKIRGSSRMGGKMYNVPVSGQHVSHTDIPEHPSEYVWLQNFSSFVFRLFAHKSHVGFGHPYVFAPKKASKPD